MNASGSPTERTREALTPSATATGPEATVGAGTAAVDAEIIDLLFAMLGIMKQHFGGAIAQSGLTPQQAHALRCLVPGHPLPMRELAAELTCDASTVTGIVDRLEERGLVQRQPARDDRRVKALVVTNDGVAVRDRLRASLLARAPHLLTLSPSERVALRDLLARVVAGNGIDPRTASFAPARGSAPSDSRAPEPSAPRSPAPPLAAEPHR